MERNFYFYSAIILTIAITIGSLISIKGELEVPVQISDKVIHTFAYLLLTINWLLAYRLKTKELKFSMLIVILVFVYGIVIEVLQRTLTTHRQLDILDIVANLVGVVIAGVFFRLILSRK